MIQYFPIPEKLKPYIDSIWSFESPEQLDANEQATVIPTGQWVLIWNYKGEYNHIIQNQRFHHPLYDLHLVSLHGSKIELDGLEPVNSIGFTFKPYGYYALAGKDVPSYVNKVRSLAKASINGKEILTAFSGNPQDAVTELSAWITERIQYHPDERVMRITHEINTAKGNIRIKDLFEKVLGSQRHLNKLFKSQVGITPKEYASIVRFQEIYNRYIRTEKRKNKADLYDFFYDESHFIQNFRKVFLTQPLQFMKKTNDLGNEFIKK